MRAANDNCRLMAIDVLWIGLWLLALVGSVIVPLVLP